MPEQTTPKQSSGLAIAGLVLGIIAAVTSFLPIINNLSAILAVIGGIFAIIALVGALRGKHTAKGLSIAGVVLCVVSFVVVLGTQSAYKQALDKATSGDQPVSSSSAKEQSSDDAAAATEEAAPAESAPAEAAPAEAEAPAQEEAPADFTNLAVGETVTLNSGLSVTVNSVDTSLENYDGSQIVCANVTYTNNGSKSASFASYDWKSEDANGAQRTSTFYLDSTDDLSSGKLSSGGSATGNIYFEAGTVRILYYSNMFNDEPTAAWNL